MANWLQKILPPAPAAKSRNLPVKARSGQVMSSLPVAPPDKLPNASVIYGVAASALLVIALYFLFKGVWFTGVLVLLPAACFLGFALQFLKTK
jgi:hypothetical protein